MTCALRGLLTPAWLKAGALANVPTVLMDGSDVPDSAYAAVINAAMATVSRRFNVALCPETKTAEKHDENTWSALGFHYFRTLRRPIASIALITLNLGDTIIFRFPAAWVDVADYEIGDVRIVPQPGSTVQYIGPTTFDNATWAGYGPGRLRVTYTAGFEAALTGLIAVEAGALDHVVGSGTLFSSEVQAGDIIQGSDGYARTVIYVQSDTLLIVDSEFPGAATAGAGVRSRVPADMVELIGVLAATMFLDRNGGSLGGSMPEGINSESLSVDGRSESVSYAGGALRGGQFAGRILGLEAQDAKLTKDLNREWRPRPIGVV